jgi:hypothetical protein
MASTAAGGGLAQRATELLPAPGWALPAYAVVWVLSDGRVVEAGSHDELIDQAGVYAELYELQARGYR